MGDLKGPRVRLIDLGRSAARNELDLAAMEGIERNALYQPFLNPRMRRMLVDCELHARDYAANQPASPVRRRSMDRSERPDH